MVLFREEKACLFESLAVECVGVFEDLAHAFHADVLRKDLLALLLEGVHVEAIGKLITSSIINQRVELGYLQRGVRRCT